MPSQNLWGAITKAAQKYWFGKDTSGFEQPPLTSNNEAITAPNAAGTALVDLIKADTSDRTVLPNTSGTVLPNNVPLKALNAAGTGVLDLIGRDAEDNLTVGGSFASQPVLRPLVFRAVLNGAVATTRFHIFGAGISGKIRKITEIHGTLGTDAGAVTGHITKEATTQAPGAGTSVMTGTFNLKGTNDTEQTATLATAGGVSFSGGDMLSFKLTGTATAVAGVLIVVWVQYDLPVFEVSWWQAGAITTASDQTFFVANRPYALRSLQYAHSVAEATDATANMQVTQDTSTNAPGAGTNLLTNDTNAGFDGNAAANVVQAGVLAAATALLAGDRLAVDFADASYTELENPCVTATFTAAPDRIEVPYWLRDGNNVDAWVFSADRDYEFYDGRFVQSVAAGGVSTANLERASGTTNASGGTALLATAWDLNATANTVVVADPVTTKATLQIPPAYRISIDFADAEQSTIGVAFTLSLKAA